MDPTFTEVLRAHVGYQLHNTLDHLFLGIGLCALLMSLGVPWLRAVVAIALFSLAREFLWQYPVRDAFALKLHDRILDVAEFTLGAMSVRLFNGGTLLARVESVLSFAFDLLVRGLLFLVSLIRLAPGRLGVLATPMAR